MQRDTAPAPLYIEVRTDGKNPIQTVEIEFPPLMNEPQADPGCSTLQLHPLTTFDVKDLFETKNLKFEHIAETHVSTNSHMDSLHTHRCPKCQKCFSKQDRLKRHMAMHSENLQRFECQECKKSFKWERSLSQHVKIHSEYNPNVCSVCRKVFSKRCHLESHLRTHVDDHKRFDCAECGKSFKWEKSLNQHCKTHMHDQFYHCPECGKSFRKSKSFNQHYKVHSADNPFCCTKCGKAFSKRSHFEGHLKIHDEEQQTFECPDCDKKFKWQKSLNAHRVLHSGNIPYKCSECGKNFTRNDSLKKHMKLHNPYGADPKVKQEMYQPMKIKSEFKDMRKAYLKPPGQKSEPHFKYIHALPFDLSTSEEQIKMYMQSIENCANFDVQKHAAKNNEFASFKIGVPTPYFEKFMQASVWPENMYIKEWQAYHQWQPSMAFTGDAGSSGYK